MAMTAQDKAKELFDKYWSLEWKLYTNVKSIKRIGMTKDAAKQCAKIAVEEILKSLDFLKNDDLSIRYWNEVLKEIDNIK